MDPLQRRIVLVTRRTRLDELVSRLNTIEQARFHVEHLGADFSDYEAEHATYQAAVTAAEAALKKFGRVQRLDRMLLPNFLFAPDALVVVLGQDGLVANTLKYLDGQAVIGVNPDPRRWDGVLLPFTTSDLPGIVPAVQDDRRPVRDVTMACVRLNDGQQLLAVNDLFIGPRSHVSARYQIRLGDQVEQHSSSGVIVSTGLGSTGWFKSLIHGALAVAGETASEQLQTLGEKGFAWEAEQLYFTVREPFPSRNTQASLVFGPITRDRPLRIVSQMPDYGVIFSDGVEKDRLEFGAGLEAEITLAERKGRLIT